MEKYDWKNKSNSRVREKLLEIKHEEESLKNKVSDLLDKIDTLQKEYYLGNETLIKRMKGIE